MHMNITGKLRAVVFAKVEPTDAAPDAMLRNALPSSFGTPLVGVYIDPTDRPLDDVGGSMNLFGKW